MPERQPVPWLIFLMLVVLTVGAAITGLVLAPPAADLVVHNAAGENLVAPSLSVTITATRTDYQGSSSSSARPLHSDVVINPTAPVNTQTLEGQEAEFVLSALERVSTHTPWTASGNSYRYIGSLAALLGIPTTQPSSQGVVHITVTGTSRVWVSGGYVAGILVHLHASAGQSATTQNQVIRFRQIGSYTPDLANVPA